MIRPLLVLLVALLPARALAVDAAAVEQVVERARSAEGIPGVSVMVVRGEKTLLKRGFGLANVELGATATPRSVYQTGSLGKTFTALGVMRLVEDGKLALDESITAYFPEAPAHWKPVTVRALLGMRSGIADYEEASLSGGDAAIDLRRDYSDAELVTRLGQPLLLFAPGSRIQYSNSNYVVLGALITRIAGEPYTDYLARSLFTPSGMKTARKASLQDLIPDRADGYARNGESLRNADWVSPTLYSTGDGGLMMSVEDLEAWHQTFALKSGFLAETAQRMWPVAPFPDGSRPVIGYALGWQSQASGGIPVVGHGGTWAGYRAYFLHVPSTGLSVAVLANLESAGTGRIAWKLAGLFDPAIAREAAAVDPDPEKTETHRAMFAALLDGKANGALMTSEAAKLWTGRARQELLDFASPVRTSKTFVLVRRDNRRAVYRLDAGRFDVVLEMALDRKGRVSAIDVTIE